MVSSIVDGVILRKKQKLDNIDEKIDDGKSENDGLSSSRPHHQSTPLSQNYPSKMSTLNIDCLEEIFEYLSIKDLHSMGQTCKKMQKVAGEYFKQNYPSAEKQIGNDGIYSLYSDNHGVINQRTQIKCFNQFISSLSLYYEDFDPFRYIQLHGNEFISVNHLYLVCVGLNAFKLSYFQAILPQIENLQIRQCTIWHGDFYDILLKFCDKLKRLYVQDDLGDIINRNGNQWLLQKYPSLEHLELTPRYSFEIVELGKFLTTNSGLRSLSMSSHSLWVNRHQLMQGNCNLEQLEVKHFDSGFYFYHVERISIETIGNILNKLFERGFYTKLHLYVKDTEDVDGEKIAMIQGLDRLSIQKINGCHLTNLVTLKELNIFDCADDNLDELASKLWRLEKVFLQNATYDNMMSFIRHSRRLKALKIAPRNNDHFNDGILKLHFMNEERKKLSNARQVTVYVDDNVFLTTKWMHGDTTLNYVEMRRATSLVWDYDYSSFQTIH